MALRGHYKTYKQVEHPTETVTFENSDGTTETLPQVENVVDQEWENAYVRVVSYHVWRRSADDMKMDINYFVYENEEAAKSGEWEDGLAYNTVVPLIDTNWEESMGNTWEVAYNALLEHVAYFEGFESV